MNTNLLPVTAMRRCMANYYAISDSTWELLEPALRLRHLQKHECLYQSGSHPASFSFVFQGLLRLFTSDASGAEYNKNFFAENSFVGCMTALLTGEPSRYSVTAVEDCVLVEINHAAFRRILMTQADLMQYQIAYLEKNWLLHKDARELEIVQQDARTRYLRFIEQFPHLSERLPQYLIASHLGITPTQLSRVRKTLGEGHWPETTPK